MLQVSSQNRQTWLDDLDGDGLLAVAEDVGQEPNGVLLDVLALTGVEQANNTVEHASLDELVSALDGITGDVAEGPDDVILDLIDAVLVEQFIELLKALA